MVIQAHKTTTLIYITKMGSTRSARYMCVVVDVGGHGCEGVDNKMAMSRQTLGSQQFTTFWMLVMLAPIKHSAGFFIILSEHSLPKSFSKGVGFGVQHIRIGTECLLYIDGQLENLVTGTMIQ